MGYRSDVAYIIKFKSDCDALDDYELEDYVYSVHRLEVNF